jgi:ferredoxin-thioredoxin reductase catalytic subunit
MKEIKITEKEVNDTYEKLKKEVEKRGYFLNPDVEFTKNLIKGLLINKKRYEYELCPCRLTQGSREKDLDAICPCDYRDADLNEHGCCYCSLYVSKKNKEKNEFKSIPERRKKEGKMETKNKLPIWRCKVCGYLCAREDAPDVCPICGVDHDRFERFE